MSLLIKNWQMADWKELLKWAKIGANNAMIGEFTEVEEVPPHGKMGDLDALRKRIEENIASAKKSGNYEWWYACTVALDFALSAPTVIEAEEGE